MLPNKNISQCVVISEKNAKQSQNWSGVQYLLKELKHEEMGVLGKFRELLREREKGVLRATRPRTPYQGEFPPPEAGQ